MKVRRATFQGSRIKLLVEDHNLSVGDVATFALSEDATLKGRVLNINGNHIVIERHDRTIRK